MNYIKLKYKDCIAEKNSALAVFLFTHLYLERAILLDLIKTIIGIVVAIILCQDKETINIKGGNN